MCEEDNISIPILIDQSSKYSVTSFAVVGLYTFIQPILHLLLANILQDNKVTRDGLSNSPFHSIDTAVNIFFYDIELKSDDSTTGFIRDAYNIQINLVP